MLLSHANCHTSLRNAVSPFEKIYGWVPDYKDICQRVQPFGASGIMPLGELKLPGKLSDNGVVCRYLHPSLKVREGTAVLVGTKVYDCHSRAVKWDPNPTHCSEWWRVPLFTSYAHAHQPLRPRHGPSRVRAGHRREASFWVSQKTRRPRTRRASVSGAIPYRQHTAIDQSPRLTRPSRAISWAYG